MPRTLRQRQAKIEPKKSRITRGSSVISNDNDTEEGETIPKRSRRSGRPRNQNTGEQSVNETPKGAIHSDTETEEEHVDASEVEENYVEIDHAKDDDDEVDENVALDSDDEDEDIADKIEFMVENLNEFSAEKESDSVLKSDEYFLAQASKSKVSKLSFVADLENFDLYEADIKQLIEKEHKLFCKEFNIQAYSEKELLKYYHLLKSDFNLILYGFGSKREVLKQFAEQHLKPKFHHVVIHGYMESIKLKDVITIMNTAIGIDADSLVNNERDLIDLMSEYFEGRDLYLLIHSIDVLYTKNVKIRHFLDNLYTSVPNVRILATVDHINSAHLWSLTESSTYRWLWFHVATFEAYLTERKYSSSQSSIFTTGSKSWKQSTNLLAVKQVYTSVNSNAQKIFLTILKLYIESRARNSIFTFYSLYLTCREEFLVNSEVTLREHLAEFRYHNLIKITKASDGAESIQVLIDKDTVKRFMETVHDADN